MKGSLAIEYFLATCAGSMVSSLDEMAPESFASSRILKSWKVFSGRTRVNLEGPSTLILFSGFPLLQSIAFLSSTSAPSSQQ